ncbi:MAG: hypothetical protein U9Q03_05420 [Patescibacteria group bacterium]|nr:hypothetical protein [Patescibacteria group bacterium]
MKERGTTLLELIIYIGIIGVVITAATLIALEFVTAKAKSSAVSDTREAARFALERMAYEIRAADGVDFGSSSFGTDPGTLYLETSNPSTDPTVFSVSSGQLNVTWGVGSAVPLTPSFLNVDSFIVENVAAPARSRNIRITLTVGSIETGAEESYSADVTMQTTVRVWRDDGFSLGAVAASSYEQSAYRMFANADSTDVGSTLAAQDAAATLATDGDAFRLRALLHITDENLAISGQSFKLQYASRSGTCDTSFTGETYADVTGATAIAYNDNATPADGAALTGNANDPVHSGHTTVDQTYEEANNFINTSQVNIGEDGMWDFALTDSDGVSANTYCLRMVESDGTLLDTYSVIPEITTAAAPPTLAQSAYRVFANADSTDVGSPLAAQDTAASLATDGDDFRLRAMIDVDVAQLASNGENFKLQYAARSGTCDTAFIGETYADVTGATAIAYNDNPTPADGAALTVNVNDPARGGRTTVVETYEEANNFTDPNAINAGSTGLWDFALTDNDGIPSVTYCLRMVKSDGSLFDTYSVIPEVTTAAGTPPTSTFDQSAYRMFANADSTDVGSTLAAQDTAATLVSNGDDFRLRALIHIGNANLTASGGSFKLQYAARSGTCDTSFTGETYADVTGATAIAYNDNATPADGAALTGNANDPVHSGHTTVDQTYEEANNFINTSQVNIGEDGMWDFALTDSDGVSANTYCLRMVESDGTLLDTYSVIPEITTAAAPPTLAQSAYRVFANADSTDVGSPLAAQDTAASLATDGDDFRLRAMIDVDVAQLASNGENFKLQYAARSGTCDTAFIGETYADVTGATAIAYNDNPTPADGAALTVNVNDPARGGRTTVVETYEEANNFTDPNAINAGSTGLWDFALTDNDGTSSNIYCLRMVKSDGSLLDTYSVIPEVTTASGVAVLTQSAYRMFANLDSTDVGLPLATQDAAATLSINGDAFRLRGMIDVDTAQLAASGQTFKLQYAARSGTCDNGFIGETYADVTGVTSIAYNDNATPIDGAALTTNVNDPNRAPRPTIAESYEEANNFTNAFAIASGSTGLWDFSLIDNDGGSQNTYCLRVVKSDGSLLDGYSVVPEVTTAAASVLTFRVTEYVLIGLTGVTGYDLTLDQNLSQDYFVIVQGSDGNASASGDRGPDENFAALTSDPFGTGDLSTSGGANIIGFTRGGAIDNWYGVVTVVECLGDCAASGFNLLDVQRVAHSGTATSGSDTSGTAWSDINQTMLMGGFNGAGCDTTQTSKNNHPVCFARIWPSSTNTINWSRGGGSMSDATSTVMVVEWGSEWTVQRQQITGTAGGNGVNATGEYNTASITSVVRDNTWVWGTGYTTDNGIGDAGEGLVFTLGDGVNQNASESTLAAGLEYTDSKTCEVYALTHSSLAVDYRFKTDGDGTLNAVDMTVDTALAGNRMALSYNGTAGTATSYPRPMFSARYLSDIYIRLERRRSGTDFPAWVQGIDFSSITY